MVQDLILLDSVTEINSIKSRESAKIIALDYITHSKLSEQKISHIISDEYITDHERRELFDYIVSCDHWYEKIPSAKKLEFLNVKILGLLNQLEFHLTFLDILIKIQTISNIIKKENPEKIFISSNLKNYVEQFIDKKNIEVLISNKTIQSGFIKEQIEIKFNIFSKPITFYIPKKIYNKLKNIQENIICKIFNLWYKPDEDRLNLILEFNAALFSSLFSELEKSRHKTVLLNQRRSAVWSWNSIQNLRKHKCKIINTNDFFNIQNNEFNDLVIKYNQLLKNFWDNNSELENIFSKNNIKFWPIMKEKLIEMYHYRLENFLKCIIIGKNILDSLKLNSILSLNEHGETEKIFHMIKHDNPTALLQHSFLRYDEQIYDAQWPYENESMYSLKSDYYLLWGNADFDYYSKFGIEKERLIVTGSPKHENYFKSNKSKQDSTEKIVLLAISPITNESGMNGVKAYEKYEKMIEKILQTLKKIKNLKIIIKLHPGDNLSNSILNKYLKKEHSDITVYQSKFSKDLIEASDIMIHTTPESYEMSTIMLEAIMLKKCVIDVYINDIRHEINSLKKGIFRINSKDGFDEITQIITNQNKSSRLIESIPEMIRKYTSNPKNASSKVSEFLENIHKLEKETGN